MKTRAEGPYTFVKYTNTAGWVAVVQSVEGRILEVSASNLISLRGRHVPPPPPAEVVWHVAPADHPAPKRKRPQVENEPPEHAPPAVTPSLPTPELNRAELWENPAFLRRVAAQDAPPSPDEAMEDVAGMIAAAMKLPPMARLPPKLRTRAPP